MKDLESLIKLFKYYKSLGEKAVSQVSDEFLFKSEHADSNSIAIIVQHLSGNMLSRWTDFLLTDGEKTWRQRDAEFEVVLKSRQEILDSWEKGWNCFLSTLENLKEEDLLKEITIRKEKQGVMEAIYRQLGHYSYHVGQIVFISRQYAKTWQSLSIPKHKSKEHVQGTFWEGSK